MSQSRNPTMSSAKKRYTSATRTFRRGACSRIPGIHAIHRGFPSGEFLSDESSIMLEFAIFRFLSFNLCSETKL